MKCVGYLRVSTLEQSLKRQKEELGQFAIDKKLELIKFFEDKISGSKVSTDQREGFKQLEQFIELNKDIKHILIIELSRLGRETLDIQSVISKYTQLGINIHIKDFNISTLKDDGSRSFESELLISFLSVMSANETRLLSDRVTSGKMSRAKENKSFTGNITGYKKSHDGTPVIDEKEAPIVRRIFELASKSTGMTLISNAIEKEFDKKMGSRTISGIIRNPFFKGDRMYKGLKLAVDKIVTVKIWEQANNYLNDNRKKFTGKVYTHVNLVQGKINCGICNSVMYQKVIEAARTNIYYCKNEKCKNTINRPWLFTVIREVVDRYAKHHLEEGVREKIQSNIQIYGARISSNRKELIKLEDRKYKIHEDYYDDNINEETKIRLVKRNTESIEKLKNEIKKLSVAVSKAETSLKKNIKHFDDDLETFKLQISNIVNSVIIGDNDVKISLPTSTSIVDKPNPTGLGWLKRKNQKPTFKIKTTKEELQMMIDDYLYSGDEEWQQMIDEHIEKSKEEHISSLGSIQKE